MQFYSENIFFSQEKFFENSSEFPTLILRTKLSSTTGYITLAGYVDSLYEGLNDKINSSEWETSQKLRRHKELELVKCKKMIENLSKNPATESVKTQKQEMQRHITLLQRQTDLDQQENDKIQEGEHLQRDSFIQMKPSRFGKKIFQKWI